MSLLHELTRPLRAPASSPKPALRAPHDDSMLRARDKSLPSTIKIDRRRADSHLSYTHAAKSRLEQSRSYDRFDREAVDSDSAPPPSPRSGEGAASAGGVLIDPRTLPHSSVLSDLELSIIASVNVAASAKPGARVVELPLTRLMREAHEHRIENMLTALSVLQDRRVIAYAVVNAGGGPKVLLAHWSDTSRLMLRLGDLLAPHIGKVDGSEACRATGSNIDLTQRANNLSLDEGFDELAKLASLSLSDSD